MIKGVRSGLDWIVQCMDDLHPWWTPIGAFNDDGVAVAYAKECFAANHPNYSYQVIERKRGLILWRSEK